MATISEIKTQLRNTATRLQKAQSKFEHIAQVSRQEISSLLNRELQIRASTLPKDELEKEKLLSVARLKAEKLMTDDEASNLMSILERYCDVLLEGRLTEESAELDRDCLEAISGIIATSPRVDSSELLSLSQSFTYRYPDLTTDRALNRNVSAKVTPYLHPKRPSQSLVDATLVEITHSQGMGHWHPPQLLMDDRRQELIQLLDAASRISIVDENRLRDLCSHGIPDLPAWLRIRAWGILLGTLPKDKSLWTTAKEKEKGDYLGLAEQLLGVLSNMPPPSTPLVPQDRSIHQFAKDIESLPTPIRDALLHHGDSNHSPDGHLIAIRHGDAVSNRITQLKGRSKVSNLPSESSIPSITLDNPPLSPEKAQTFSEQQSVSPTTVLLPSSLITNPTAVYEDTILRLLYVHSSVHALHAQPMGPSPALAAIFAVVLDVALRAHNSASLDMVAIEAEVFWLVEAIVGKVMELLEPEEEKDSWAAKFSKMTRWADQDLWIDLSKKGLDPALPYYSYRWVPTLFTHALPISVLLPVWDALFSAAYLGSQSTLHDTPPQSAFVYTVGTSMLIRARAAIFHSTSDKSPISAISSTGSLAAFWKRQTGVVQEIQLPHSPSAYSPVASPKTPLSPTMGAVPSGLPGWTDPRSSGRMTPGTASNVFLVSVKLLQDYDIDSFGGTERLLDTTWSLWRKWNKEGGENIFAVMDGATLVNTRDSVEVAPVQTGSGVLGGLSKIRNMAWKGITNELSDDSDSLEEPPKPISSPHNLPTPELTITSPTSTAPLSTGMFSSFGSGLGSKFTQTVWKGMTNQIDTPEASPEASPAPSSAASPILVAHDEKAPPLEMETEKGGPPTSWAGDTATSWAVGYAEKWKDSDTAAALLRTGTNLRVKALDAWTRKAPQTTKPDNEEMAPPIPPNRPQVAPEEAKRRSVGDQGGNAGQDGVSTTASSVGSWGEMFAKRGSLALVGSWIGDPRKKEESDKGPDTATSWESGSSKRTSYSPPPRPAQFRVGRDSMIGAVFGRGNPEMAHLPTLPSTNADSEAKNPLQAALSALGGSLKTEEQPKRGPKPLLLSSSSLITPSVSRPGLHSRTPSRTPSRRPSPNPTPRIGDRASLPPLSHEDGITPGASSVVSLRRGPLTNPRTAGYPTPQREGTHSSQASLSSTFIPIGGNRAYSVDLGADFAEKRLRPKRSISSQGGFLVDHGEGAVPIIAEQRVQLRDDGFQASNPNSSREGSPYRGRRYTVDEAGRSFSSENMAAKPRRYQTKPTPISTDPPPPTIPELAVITPRSGEMMIASPNPIAEESFGITQSIDSAVKTKESSGGIQETTEVGASRLSRSRTPLRRKVSGTPNERMRPPNNRENSGAERLSVAKSGSGSGSDDGLQGDIEDIYEAY